MSVSPAAPMIAYNPNDAMLWSGLVNQAYDTFSNHPGNANPPPPVLPPGWNFVANLQVNLHLLGTYYFIGWILSGSNGQTAFVFLGTEDLEWLYDLDAEFTPHPLGGFVEAGMYAMYQSLSSIVPGATNRTSIANAMTSTLTGSGLVTVTGHSLGGAFTTFVAAEIATSNMQIYSIASPRVGDATFAAAFNQKVANNFRIYNIQDYVPTLPPSELGFVHVQTALPQPELDSWQYPIYHGFNPIRAAECYHSHAGYFYMLSVLAGQSPNAKSLLGTCYAPTQPVSRVQLTRSATPPGK